jgi:hypothetical protein
MSATYKTPDDPDQPGIYQIRIKGCLDARWAARFEGMTLTPEDTGNTLLTGSVADQAALHGLLRKVRDLGMPLISVTRVNPGPAVASEVKTELKPTVLEGDLPLINF